MKSAWVFLLTLLFFYAGHSQLNLHEVSGLPTKELHDLHVDKKGYLWIAHELGISRFDGLNFLHFSHPRQASLGMSDLTEDAHGRIWCHNFSAQIFYVENGKINLLTDYEATKETQYPRIALCGDELLATSDRGLFVCSTADLKTRYVSTGSKNSSRLSSLAVIGNQAILFDNGKWYIYSKEKNIQRLHADTAIRFEKDNLVSIQPTTVGSTFFVIANPSGIVQMISLKGNNLHLEAKLEMNDFTNAVTINDKTWIHTRNESKPLGEEWSIRGQSLTDVVTDQEGNTWFSSLKKGLLVNYKKPRWELMNPPVGKEDFVRCLNVADGYFFAGTNKGNLLLLDSTLSKIEWQKTLFDGYGSIDFIRFFKEHTFVAGSSVNTYIVNPLEKKVKDLLPLSSVRDVDFDENSLFLATTNGFYMMPFVDSANLQGWQQTKQNQYPFIKTSQADDAWLFAANRSWAVRHDKSTRSLFVSFKNGLHSIDEKGIHPYFINNKQVFASSLWYKHPRLFIATFKDGLWIKTGKDLRHFTTENFLTSNTILRTKATANHLWLFENETMQVIDIETESLLKNLELPKLNGANVFDVAEWNGFGYLTTAEGIYKIPMNAAGNENLPTGYLDAVIANNKDTLKGTNLELPYNSNDLQFILSSPSFYDPSTISFKYRVRGLDEDWRTTGPGERVLRYPSLQPGRYIFQAYVVNNKGTQQKHLLEFSVEINKPWWKQWWFYFLLLLIATGIIYFLYQYQVSQLLKVEKVRRNISSDLHDDIGATLSSINIYTELAKKEKNNKEYLDAIQQHSKEITGKLDDLIWSINPRNDSFEKLISRMHSYALPVLQAKNIACTFTYNDSLLKEKLLVQVKQNLYLVFKELVNNIVKHSGAKNCFVNLTCRDNLIILSVKDDGKGYSLNNEAREGNGIINIKERVEKMHGYIEIQSAGQTGCSVFVYVPLANKYVSFLKKWFKH